MKLITYVCLTALAVMLTSCRTVESQNRGFHEAPADRRTQLLKESKRLGNGILQAFRQGDFVALTRNIPGDLLGKLTEKDFSRSCSEFRDKFGELEDFKLLTSLDTPAFGNLIWVATFVRSGTGGADIRRQLLFRLVTMELDGETRVVSFGFI